MNTLDSVDLMAIIPALQNTLAAVHLANLS